VTEWITTEEAAALLGISKAGVGKAAARRGWQRKPDTSTNTLGWLYRREDIEKYAEARNVPQP